MKRLSSELCYVLGIVLLAVGTALIVRADFGVSMVVAPAYVLHLAISPFWAMFSFGMSEYCLQGVLLVIMMLIIRRFRMSYMFSIVTAVLYGFLLDGATALLSLVAGSSIPFRIGCLLLGGLFAQAGVAFCLHTYIAPEVYELFVKEVSRRFSRSVGKVKTIFDVTFLLLAIAMSFLFFGSLQGIGWGTVVITLVNGYIIGKFSGFLDKHFTIYDWLPFRSRFEDAE